MIEFPRKSRVEIDKQIDESSVPSWRKELNERVRAVRARKSAASVETPTLEVDSAHMEVDHEDHLEHHPGRRVRKAEMPQRASRISSSSIPVEPAAAPPPAPRTSNAIVEAALSRVRRASENASRASLSRIEPVRPAPAKATGSIAVDKEATARALDITAEFNPTEEMAARLLPRMRVPETAAAARALETSQEILKAEMAKAAPGAKAEQQDRTVPAAPAPVIQTPPPTAAPAPIVQKTAPQVAAPAPIIQRTAPPTAPPKPPPPVLTCDLDVDELSAGVIDEIEPLDYLQAEIRKIAQGEEFAHNESPSLVVHAIIGVVDLLTIAISSIPFLAVIQLVNGNIAESKTQVAAGLIVLLVAFFYLAVTQCLSGKTLGMMLTNTRVIDAYTFDPPSGQRMLLRTIGYFVAVAPAMLGIVWIAFNRYRRGWHDVISGTRIVRDF